MSIYQIDNEIEKLETFVDIYSKDLECLYLEREFFSNDIEEKSKINIFKLEKIIMDYSDKLDQLYFHRNLILNK